MIVSILTDKTKDGRVPKGMDDYFESVRNDNTDLQNRGELAAKFKDLTIHGKPVEAKDLQPPKVPKKLERGKVKRQKSWF